MGPAVGAKVLRKVTAAGLMTVFVFLGGWTVGRNVMDTLAGDVITIAISLEAGVAVLFFIGPASSSRTSSASPSLRP